MERHRLRPRSNPQRGASLGFSVETPGLEKAVLKAYSPSMALVAQAEFHHLPSGWNSLDLPVPGLSPGLYWVRLSGPQGPLASPACVVLLP